MAGRPNSLPWNFATFTGNEPVTTLSDNFTSLNNIVNDSGAGWTSYAVDTGTANNLVVTLPSAPVAYEAGMMVCTRPVFTNTGASVINVNALGNVPIVNPANIALIGGEFSKNALLPLVYDGTSFRIIGPCPLSFNTSTAASSLTVECAGYTSIMINVGFSNSGGFTLIPAHLAQGVTIIISVTNTSGSPTNVAIIPTTPSGASYTTITGYKAGSASGVGQTTLGGSGTAINNSLTFTLVGAALTATVVVFSM
jgi:hypothetical protein